MSEPTPVVTCFLRNRGEVLVIRRSDAVGTYPGRWGGISGYVEEDPGGEDPAETARREIAEETGLLDAVTLTRRGEPLTVVDEEYRFRVHPFLFDCADRGVEPNEEIDRFRWTAPTTMLDMETVPSLWETYRRIAPTVETVAGDDTSGSAAISIRALEVLRDRAGEFAHGVGDDVGIDDENGDEHEDEAAGWDDCVALANALLDARPSMAALGNRIHRVMDEAVDARTATAVERAARNEIDRAFAADEQAAANAAERCRGASVLTLSRSGTVLDALRTGEPASVTVLESRPNCEGVGVAESLADAGIDATLTIDAAVSHLLAERPQDLVLVGADTVFPDGSVVNKVGTRTTAVAADHAGVPVFAVAATDKVSSFDGSATDELTDLEPGDPDAVYGGDRTISVDYPTFDVTPSSLVTGVITERGVLAGTELAEVATEHERRRGWNRTRE